jgi:hypothetical protein
MTYSNMFADQEAQTFEQRRDEVVAIVSSAVDLAGIDRGLVALLDRLTTANDENEFDEAFDEVLNGIRGTTAQLADLA